MTHSMRNASNTIAYCSLAVLICTLRGWRRKSRFSAPRSADAASLVSDRAGVSPARACQVVCVTLSHLLAGNRGFHLAVPAWVGGYPQGSLFSGGGSYDACDWSCLPLRNSGESSLANNSAPISDPGCDRFVRCAPMPGVSREPVPIHRNSLAPLTGF